MNLRGFSFYNNDGQSWLIAVVVAIVVFIGLLITRRLLVKRLGSLAEKTKTSLDDAVVNFIDDTRGWFLLIVALYAGSHFLTLPQNAQKIVENVIVGAFLIQLIFWANDLIDFIIVKFVKRGGDEVTAKTSLPVIRFIGRVLFYSFIFVLALDNFGFDVSTMLAGLGVGGIAIALAMQNVLGDLMSSLSIIFDKPFVVGDFIIVGSEMGNVEKIGLKTTRVRSLSGEQLIFSNTDLLNSRIRNYKRMQERRILFKLGVTYQTPLEKLKKIPEIIKTIIDSQPKARFDRCHFTEYGDFSLNIETVMYIQSPEYIDYVNTHQAINFSIFEAFEREKIEFAYPTQTVFVEKTGTA